MNEQTLDTLGFYELLADIAAYTRTEKGKQSILDMRPLYEQNRIAQQLNETREAMAIVARSSSVPIHSANELEGYLQQAHKGLYIRADQLAHLISFLDHCRKLKRFMKDKQAIAPTVSAYAFSIGDLHALEERLGACIRLGQVDDHASSDLAYVRRQLQIIQTKLKDKAQQLVNNKRYAPYLQDKTIVDRGGKLALAVKKEFRTKVEGTVIDQSSSGATLFIEPTALGDIQEERALLQIAEEAEVERILYELTKMVLNHETEIHIAIETMHHYDVLFAKAKYSASIDAAVPTLNEEYRIDLRNARHPKLGNKAVPLSIKVDEHERALVITGPNTGGKTVTLKTVGLLTLMAQSGLPIPAEPESSIAIFRQVFVDIGDGQSIADNLSTFSSRMVNIIAILREANDQSLILIDELGSGTDPGEGMALATVILEQLFQKGATLMATTHYSEIKQFATKTPGFVNAAMEFDMATLAPTYRLMIGESGKSQAFDIAIKLGLHPKMVERAHMLTYQTERSYSAAFSDEQLKQAAYQKQIVANKYARARKKAPQKAGQETQASFRQGDAVTVIATGEHAIVYKGPDKMGNCVVQLKGEKQVLNHKRLKLAIPATELYPPDYDFDILFKSKEYRVTKKQLTKKHVDGLTLEEED